MNYIEKSQPRERDDDSDIARTFSAEYQHIVSSHGKSSLLHRAHTLFVADRINRELEMEKLQERNRRMGRYAAIESAAFDIGTLAVKIQMAAELIKEQPDFDTEAASILRSAIEQLAVTKAVLSAALDRVKQKESA